MLPAPAACPGAQPREALAQRVRILEDGEQIRVLRKDSGRLLEQRDFEGFGQRFATDGEYLSGGATTRGPAAIGASRREILMRNALGIREPNFHVFFNGFINVTADTATATSQSRYGVPGDANKPDLAPRPQSGCRSIPSEP